jgi:hypothetical protein
VRQRRTLVETEQLPPPSGRLVLDDDRNVAHRPTEIGGQGAQRLVNRLFERIVETRVPTRIHLRNDATIGAGIVAACSKLEEIAQLGRTLWRRRVDTLGFFDHHASNGPTEAINDRREALRRNALGFRNLTQYR